MLLSRFWYVVMAVALGAVLFALFLSTSMYDRASVRAMGEALAGDSQVVASYLRDDARKRSTALIVPALDEDIRTQLAKSSASIEKVPPESKDKVRAALKKQANAIPAEQRFDAIFAVDQAGRVVGSVGFDQASGIENFELGGYPVVADALHGWVRDDTWVLGGRLYRVVGRPVEQDVTQAPAGAIIGARVLDDAFAREVSKRTGAAIGFYANGARVSSGAPEGFDTAQLDTIGGDLKSLESDTTYKDKGFSDVRTLHDNLGVVYAKLIGEAWDLGAGYAVARNASLVGSPLGFLHAADDKDKRSVPLAQIFVAGLGVALIGIFFSYLEHSRPLSTFRSEAEKFSKGTNDQLTPSKFRGVYRQIASFLNEGMEKVAAKGGAPRRAADLESVLGPMPAQPAMSAFSLPQDGPSSSASPARAPSFPQVPPSSSGSVPGPIRPPMPTPAPGPGAIKAPAPAPAPVAVRAETPPAVPPASSALSAGLPTPQVMPAAAAIATPPAMEAATPVAAPAAPAPIASSGASPGAASPVAGSPAAPGAPSPVAASPAVPAAPAAPRPPRPPGKIGSPTLLGVAPAAPAPKAPAAPTPAPAPARPAAPVSLVDRSSSDDDEATVVSQVPSEILGQLAADRGTGRPPPFEDEAAEWKRIYEEFVQLKKECGEPIEGLSFDKFKNTLRKNRDQLLQRHGCKAVRFSVYVKDGKAALKANPVRE